MAPCRSARTISYTTKMCPLQLMHVLITGPLFTSVAESAPLTNKPSISIAIPHPDSVSIADLTLPHACDGLPLSKAKYIIH